MRGRAGSATRSLVLAPALAAFVLFVACGPTYGESAPSKPPVEAGPPIDPTAIDSGNTPPPSDDGGGVSPTPDAGPDAPSGPPCPPCPAGNTCIGSGCVGAGVTSNSCDSPTSITVAANTKLTLFLCPGGQTITFPAACDCGSTAHAVAIYLETGKWTAKASGVNPFLATGDCTTITSVTGASDTTSKDYSTTPTTLVVGTTEDLTSCRTIVLDLTSR